jgi:probable HAF family extracellular repeat protein
VEWQKGTLTALGTLAPGEDLATVPYAIDDSGQIVGGSETDRGVEHAFPWQRGRMRDLGTLAGKSSSGSMIDLGTLGGKSANATAINDRGQGDSFARVSSPGGISGPEYTKGELGTRAFLWEKGKLVALTTPPAILSAATAINENDQIIGTRTATMDSARAVLSTKRP